AGVGLLEAASGIGSILGAAAMLALVARNRLGADFGAGIVLWGAPLVVVGLLTNTGVAIAAWFILGLGNTLVDVSAMTLIQRSTPTAVAGRVFGVLESVFVGGLAIGAPLLSPLPLQRLERLAGQVEPLLLPAGATLFNRGYHGDRFNVLTQGALA